MDWDRIMDTWSANGSINISEIYFYMFCRLTEFMRLANLPEEHWIWLDNNIFAGAAHPAAFNISPSRNFLSPAFTINPETDL